MSEIKNQAATPGPWFDAGDGWIAGPNNVDVCDYAGCGSHAAKWNPADLVLAVAAPEMLAVLQQIHAHGYDMSEHEMVRKVITKATGVVP